MAVVHTPPDNKQPAQLVVAGLESDMGSVAHTGVLAFANWGLYVKLKVITKSFDFIKNTFNCLLILIYFPYLSLQLLYISIK